jgi:anti-sigma factor RsiW
MSSLLQKLQNEAILLLYLADELPAEDRAEVKQMLSVDAQLRAELQQLQSSQEKIIAELANLDRVPTRISEAVAVRQVSRAMKQWQVDRLSRPVETPVVKRGLRYPWWAYPAVSVASIVLASIIWWGMAPSGGPVSHDITTDNSDPVKQLMVSFQDSNQPNTGTLADAEQEAIDLNHPADSNFMPDSGQ